jgi:hypothetical protein
MPADSILLFRFEAIYLIHAGMAAIDTPAPAPEVDVFGVGADAEPVNLVPRQAGSKATSRFG